MISPLISDRTIIAQAVTADCQERGLAPLEGAAGSIPCPKCSIGTLRYFRWSHGEGLWALCNRVGCLMLQEQPGRPALTTSSKGTAGHGQDAARH